MGRISIKEQEILIFLSSLSPSITCNRRRSVCSPSDASCLTDGTPPNPSPHAKWWISTQITSHDSLPCRANFATFHNPLTPPLPAPSSHRSRLSLPVTSYADESRKIASITAHWPKRGSSAGRVNAEVDTIVSGWARGAFDYVQVMRLLNRQWSAS